MPQIIATYTRQYNFVMQEYNIGQWAKEVKDMPEDTRGILRLTPPNIILSIETPLSELTLKLQGRLNPKQVFNLQTLAAEYELPELPALTKDFLISHIYNDSVGAATDAADLMDAPLEAFHTLEVPLQMFNNSGHILHKLRCTRPYKFLHGDQLHDWVFVRRRKT